MPEPSVDGSINKTMDRADLERPDAREVVAELDELVRRCRRDDLPISAWYGTFDLAANPNRFERLNRGYGYEPLPGSVDDTNFPWFLYWEIAWLVVNNDYRPGQRLLDMGGSSSLFSYYLASKGVEVVTVDLQRDLVDNGNKVAERTGWPLSNHVMDMRQLAFDQAFDHIASICVFEHLPMSGRIEVSSQVRELLVGGGSFSITFDFGNPSRFARIRSDADVREQFVAPSGLALRGNERFADQGERYLLHPVFHPKAWVSPWKIAFVRSGEFRPHEVLRTKRSNDYTFGALFLRK